MDIGGTEFIGDEALVVDIIQYLHFVMGAYKWPMDHAAKNYVLSTKADELLQRITGTSHSGVDFLKLHKIWLNTQWKHIEDRFPESKIAIDYIKEVYELKEKYQSDDV